MRSLSFSSMRRRAKGALVSIAPSDQARTGPTDTGSTDGWKRRNPVRALLPFEPGSLHPWTARHPSGARRGLGTLGLPTHSYSYPETTHAPGPIFDAAAAPSQNGSSRRSSASNLAQSAAFIRTHSLAMIGPQAQELTDGHYSSETPCGRGTPYGRMIERRASALMWGVTFHSYTFYHTAEDAADSPFAYEPQTRDRLRVVDETGQIQERISRRQTRNARRFAQCGNLMEQAGLVRRAQLGAGVLLFVPDCAKAHDFLVERLRKIPNFLYLDCPEPLV